MVATGDSHMPCSRRSDNERNRGGPWRGRACVRCGRRNDGPGRKQVAEEWNSPALGPPYSTPETRMRTPLRPSVRSHGGEWAVHCPWFFGQKSPQHRRERRRTSTYSDRSKALSRKLSKFRKRSSIRRAFYEEADGRRPRTAGSSPRCLRTARTRPKKKRGLWQHVPPRRRETGETHGTDGPVEPRICAIASARRSSTLRRRDAPRPTPENMESVRQLRLKGSTRRGR